MFATVTRSSLGHGRPAQGLAAPEWDEPLGTEAREALIKLVHGRMLQCELDGERTHDRCVGVCSWTARISARSWFAVAWPGTAPDSAVGAMPRQRTRLLPTAQRSRAYPLPGYGR
jgi:hypothetical protein